MPTKVMSALATSSSVGWIIGWLMQHLALLGRRGDDRQRHREAARLDRIGHREDDVVERRRPVGRDVAGQRHDLVLRALHRRKLLDRGLQRAAGADRQHDRLGRPQPPLDLGGGGLGDADRRRRRCRDRSARPRRRSSAKRERRRSASSMQLAIGWSSRTLISPSETASDTSRCAALPGNAELGGDLVLRVAGDVIEPAGARRIVVPELPFSGREPIQPPHVPARNLQRPSRIVDGQSLGKRLFDRESLAEQSPRKWAIAQSFSRKARPNESRRGRTRYSRKVRSPVPI